jgi:hypothetical protein
MIELKVFNYTNSEYLSMGVKDWLKENPNIKIISTCQSSTNHSTILHIFFKKKLRIPK